MVSNKNYVKTKVSGVHWKFLINLVNNRYVIVNQRDKRQFIIEEVSLTELKQKLGGPSQQRTKKPEVRSNKIHGNNQNEEVTKRDLRKKLGVLINEQKVATPDVTNNVIDGHKMNNQPKRKGLFHWFLKILRGN